MSKRNTSQASVSTGPACEGKTLIIEVMGDGTPAPHHEFRLYDETDQVQQEGLENQRKAEALDDQLLHVWPWERQPARNVWLEIEAEAGAPVRVPLFRNVAETPRQEVVQWNRVWPVVPQALIRDDAPLPGHPDWQAMPLRPGFLYIFRDGRLWRELQVSAGDDGAPQFQDVRLLDYRRRGQAGVTDDRRPAVGVPLDAIWLPVRGMNRTLNDAFEFAFSDAQWSASRVAYLEREANARAGRCVRLRGMALDSRTLTAGQLATFDSLPPMRPREPLLEMTLAKPWKSVHDLTGTFANNLFGQAREEQEAFNAGGDSADDAWREANQPGAPLWDEPGARFAAFGAAQAGNGETSALWQPLGSAADANASARASGYCALLLDDPQFDLRHSLNRGLDAQHYLEALQQAAVSHPHADTAQLIQQTLVPDRINGEENAYHAYLKHIDSGLFGSLHRALHTGQRQLAVEALAAAQRTVARVFRQPEAQAILADYFSLRGADYVEGFALTRDLFQMLALDPNKADSALTRGRTVVQTAPVRDAGELLGAIVTGEGDVPLHVMLFPPETPAEADPVAEGDGRCRPDDLHALADLQLDPGGIQTLSAAAMLALARQADMNLSTEAKRWSSLVNGLLNAVDSYARGAAMTLKSAAHKINANVYGPLLRLAQARDPSFMGRMRFMPRSQVPSDWIVFGVHDPEIGLEHGLTEADKQYVHPGNQHRKFYGEFLDSETGEPLASTARSRLPNVADTAAARELHVYAAPATNDVVQSYRQYRSLKRWQDIADRFRVPYFVLMVEAFNLLQERSMFEEALREKGRFRTFAGAISAIYDLAFASAIAAERMHQSMREPVKLLTKLASGLDNTAFRIPHTIMSRFSTTLARALPELVTYRLLGGIVSGVFFTTVSILDIAHEWDTGDGDAALAFGASAVGGSLMIVSTLMYASLAQSGAAVVLLGMGPGGWLALGLTLAIGGGIAALLLNDAPLEEWLKRGPFGIEQDDAYPHLRNDPAETYYRGLDVFTKPRISIEPVANLPATLAREGYEVPRQREVDYARVNTRVTVENPLASLLNGALLETYFRGSRKTASPTRRGIRYRTESLDDNINVVLGQPLANGQAYYIALPPRETFAIYGQSAEGVHSYDVAVRAQWQYQGQGRHWVFPAPELASDRTFHPAADGQPDFEKSDRAFWADEQSYKAEDA
ncbi:hypothetical protein [Marinobacter fonticola]|uniref:hypothetical protein n=1 Tax=Marinobacter fonticola TaxID=2603215 RepID=UPI0011E74677|nr:hypothetical protein [Marinobacter fonticola]